MDDRCYWIWLQSALGVQSRLEEAIAYFGTARRLYEAGELEWKLAGLFTARQLEKLRSQRLTQAEEILKQCAGNGWLALTPEDPCYPKRLRAIPNFPAALYVWGRMPDLDGRVALAVVGAREASFQGRQIAQGLCKAFAQAGAVVVSGGALGIDSAAHMGALEGGGETVAFLGCGLGARYLMENQYLRESIAAHGAVVSEFPPGTPPGRTTFPVRNRLLSGVSCGTVVIEAGEKSGSLITARCALEQGRDVFAVPGDIVSSAYTGANRLIRDGAKPVLTAMDVLEEYQYLYPDTLHLTGADRPFAKLQKKQGQALHNMHNCARMHNIRETQAVSAQAAGSKSMPEHLSAPAKQLLTLLSAGALYVDEAADRLRLPAQYVWGRMPDLDGRVALAVVGAREASFQGRQIAQGLCKAFAQAGAVVVSGGALGIDSAAHMGALYVDEAADRLRLPAQDILRAFTELELYDLVRPESGRRYTLL